MIDFPNGLECTVVKVLTRHLQLKKQRFDSTLGTGQGRKVLLPGQKTGNLLLFGNKRLMNAQNKLTNGSGPKQTPAVVQGYTVCTNVLYTVCTKTGPHFVL